MSVRRVDNIEYLLDKLQFYIDNFDELSILFMSFYVNQKRHRYASVSKYINEKAIQDEQTVYFIQMNLNQLITHCRNKKEEFEPQLNKTIEEFKHVKEFSIEDFIEKLEKLEDHIGLEEQRFLFTQKREAKIFSSRIEEFTESTEVLKYSMEDKSTRLENNLTASVISVLGIFAAFITTFFGGLNVFGSIMTNLNETSKFRVVFAILLLGFILFNICFTLLYCISKILDKNIGSYVSFDLIDRFEESEGRYKKILYWIQMKIQRFPILIFFNVIIMFGMVITIILKSLDYYGIFVF